MTRDPVDLQGVPPYASPSGLVYVVHEEFLKCLDVKDGTEKWRVGVHDVELQVAEWQGQVAVFEHSGRLRFFYTQDGSTVRNEVAVPTAGILAPLDDVTLIYAHTFVHAYDMHSGRELWRQSFIPDLSAVPYLISVHAGDGIVIEELYSAEKGYTQLQSYDPRFGQKRWSALGTVLALQDGRLYVHKKQEQEVWVRDLATGGIAMSGKELLVHRLEQYNGKFFQPLDNDVLYSSDQRFFEPEASEISADGVHSKQSTPFTVTEIVRQSLGSPKKILWHISVDPGSDVFQWSVQDGILWQAGGQSSSHGDAFHSLAAYRLTDAALLWRIDCSAGFTHFTARDHHLLFTTLDGWLHTYQYE